MIDDDTKKITIYFCVAFQTHNVLYSRYQSNDSKGNKMEPSHPTTLFIGDESQGRFNSPCEVIDFLNEDFPGWEDRKDIEAENDLSELVDLIEYTNREEKR